MEAPKVTFELGRVMSSHEFFRFLALTIQQAHEQPEAFFEAASKRSDLRL